MNNIVISFGLMFILIIAGSLIGTFFDVSPEYYLPFLFWGIALCIFNLILNKNKENIYMKNIN
tara:strand:+ start:762 stop:950 length:189 start_codon:yes stop_codon:yes gene_type:complete